jgi:hypothetical protein
MGGKKIVKETKVVYKKLKEFDVRKGLYPVKIGLTVWGDNKSKPFIDFYSGGPMSNGGYFHNHFKISSKQIWLKIKKIVETELLEELTGKKISDALIEKQELEDIAQLKKDNKRLKKRIQNYSKAIREYRKIKLPDYINELKELEKKLKSAKKEQDLQDFLSKHPWFLGLEYETADPQKIGVKKRYDFYMQRYDGYADIVEIKKANENLFGKKGKMSATLSSAIQQLIEYIDDAILEGDSKRISKKLTINFLKPKGILIIGKGTKDEIDKLKILADYFHNIEILTYSELLKRGKQIIKNLQKEHKSKV